MGILGEKQVYYLSAIPRNVLCSQQSLRGLELLMNLKLASTDQNCKKQFLGSPSENKKFYCFCQGGGPIKFLLHETFLLWLEFQSRTAVLISKKAITTELWNFFLQILLIGLGPCKFWRCISQE